MMILVEQRAMMILHQTKALMSPAAEFESLLVIEQQSAERNIDSDIVQ
jgi:hypothetical protein